MNALPKYAGSPVFTFGEPLAVLMPDHPRPLRVHHRLEVAAAGAELNTAVGLARLGVPVAMAGCVGDDAFGEMIRRTARGEGIDTTLLDTAPGHPTGIYCKFPSLLADDPQVLYYRGLSPMGQGTWDATAARAAIETRTWAWLHATGITWALHPDTRRQALSLMQAAAHRGIPVSFDINIRLRLAPVDTWRGIAREVAPHVTWWLCGDEEVRLLFDSDDPETVRRRLEEDGFRGEGVIIKRGADGVDGLRGGELVRVAAWPVPRVVDTVGAGDGFNAGWIFGQLAGLSCTDALRLGTLVAAFAVVHPGDHDGYPTFTEAARLWRGQQEVTR